MIQVTLIPALRDNYIAILKDEQTGAIAAVDPSEARPVFEYMGTPAKLDAILITHHHWDHTGGIVELKQKTSAKVFGPAHEMIEIKGLDSFLKEGDSIPFGSTEAHVLEIPGHTIGHIAIHFSKEKLLFTGDTLFSLGCGRLFEGRAEQLYESLQRLKQLPSDTQIYCGHEYTEKNLSFAISQGCNSEPWLNFKRIVESKRAKNLPTLPTTLQQELELNPFLKAKTFEEFKNLRLARDKF